MCVYAVLRSSHSLLLWFSHFPYLVGKKCFFSSPFVRPTNRSEHFLTVVVVIVVVAKSSTWILHQHKGNALSLSILQSLHHTEMYVCVRGYVCVYVYKSMFFAALLSSYLSRIVSLSFSPIFLLCIVSICYLNNYDKQQHTHTHTVAFRIGCKLYIFPYYLLFSFLLLLMLLCVYTLQCKYG